jgi:DNA-binding HxlR family transcriptional regulator
MAKPMQNATRPAVPELCTRFHRASELIGRRWTGAIIEVLRQEESLRFSEIVGAIPGLSDRLCSERVKELEARGLVQRTVHAGPPVRVDYALTEMGRALGPALSELRSWARDWLGTTDARRESDRSRGETAETN